MNGEKTFEKKWADGCHKLGAATSGRTTVVYALQIARVGGCPC